MKVWLRRAVMAAIFRACPTGLTTFCALPGRFLPPLILVPGATPSQELKCWAEGKAEKSGPISEAMTMAVPGPMAGIFVRSMPIMLRNARARTASCPKSLRVPVFAGVSLTGSGVPLRAP